MLLHTHTFDPLAASILDTYVLSCPWCDEALFHLEAVPDTPFLSKRSDDPIIHSQDGELFCFCPQCAVRVEVRSEGGRPQVFERMN